MNQSIDDFHYKKKLGAFRPNFQGKPITYYTLSCCDICCGLFACSAVIALAFAVCIGLFLWSQYINTDSLITIWSIVMVAFTPLFMVVAFCFSKGKAQVQQGLIKRALQKQMKGKDSKQDSPKGKKLDKDDSRVHMLNLTQEDFIEK